MLVTDAGIGVDLGVSGSYSVRSQIPERFPPETGVRRAMSLPICVEIGKRRMRSPSKGLSMPQMQSGDVIK
jgi:hypothetical protein